MRHTETLPETLKEQLAEVIVASFLKDADIADSMMRLAIELTEPLINPENHDLFSEVSGMVGYRLAEFFKSPFENTTPVPVEFCIDTAERVVKGEAIALYSAFDWGSTSQGASYWYDRYQGDTPLSDDDTAQIERWIKIAKSQNL
jgi:hypothetical protein